MKAITKHISGAVIEIRVWKQTSALTNSHISSGVHAKLFNLLIIKNNITFVAKIVNFHLKMA
jgi:hypothetical protein